MQITDMLAQMDGFQFMAREGLGGLLGGHKPVAAVRREDWPRCST